MFQSSTVENYLKAIYQAEPVGENEKALVPMGQLAATVGVVPGTATTMVKTLADAGLVSYEPYSGVRLTPAGRKLAALVLRRHRLIESFLVQILGMSWTEVHDEAERLEHAASDRLIERINDILGQPSVDPHGDPIPGPEGTITQHNHYHYNLTNCPLQTPVIVTRVTDQDKKFLRFVETSNLRPGQGLQVELRDTIADSVQLCSENDQRITIGMRAATKLLVKLAQIVSFLVLFGGSSIVAQTRSPEKIIEPFKILDNSFLVEEAFNQEPGVFQNIFTFTRSTDSRWEAGFTQEWPLGTQDHQLSFTIPLQQGISKTGIGDVQIHYRFQATTEGTSRPAFSPRLSIILPSGDNKNELGSGAIGWQLNLPVSKQTGNFYWHWNSGFTYLSDVKTNKNGSADRIGRVIPHLAASAIWRATPMLNFLLETVAEFPESIDAGSSSSSRTTVLTVSPGFRGGWNIGEQQVIIGLAAPIAFTNRKSQMGVFTYVSYELKFTS